MQDDPRTFHLQDEMAIRRTLSQPCRIFRCLAVRQYLRAQQWPRQAQLGRVRHAARRAASRAAAHAVSRVLECAASLDASTGHTGATIRSGVRPTIVERYRSFFEISATRCEIRCAKTSSIRFATQDLQQSTGEEAVPVRVKDGSLNVSHRRWRGLWYPVR
jgi:hypothetical protein